MNLYIYKLADYECSTSHIFSTERIFTKVQWANLCRQMTMESAAVLADRGEWRWHDDTYHPEFTVGWDCLVEHTVRVTAAKHGLKLLNPITFTAVGIMIRDAGDNGSNCDDDPPVLTGEVFERLIARNNGIARAYRSGAAQNR